MALKGGFEKLVRTGNFARTQANHILERDGYKCVYCGDPAQQIDHVVPASRGGPTKISNGVSVCKRCNAKKKGKLEIDYLTRGLFHLSQVGENTDWVDSIGEKGRTYDTARIKI